MAGKKLGAKTTTMGRSIMANVSPLYRLRNTITNYDPRGINRTDAVFVSEVRGRHAKDKNRGCLENGRTPSLKTG